MAWFYFMLFKKRYLCPCFEFSVAADIGDGFEARTPSFQLEFPFQYVTTSYNNKMRTPVTYKGENHHNSPPLKNPPSPGIPGIQHPDQRLRSKGRMCAPPWTDGRCEGEQEALTGPQHRRCPAPGTQSPLSCCRGGPCTLLREQALLEPVPTQLPPTMTPTWAPGGHL